MIPQRVLLRGFLCYRDEQEIHFDGSSLWLLAGMNGSGKSAVFDAVTYALFGYHRGGQRDAGELMNHASNSLLVEFDFSLDGKRYQIRRTLTRKPKGDFSSTQQIYEVDGGGNLIGIEKTERSREFAAWIQENIGLNYHTFTSSVLLVQGRAERLIDSNATERFNVLASIVDLDRYKRLHEKADGERKRYKGTMEALQHQVDGLPEVTPEELVVADTRIELAENERQRASAEVDRLQGVEQQARLWGDLQGRLATVEKRWRDAQVLIRETDEIRRNWERLRELRDVVEDLDRIVTRRGKIGESRRTLERLATERTKLDENMEKCVAALAQAHARSDTTRRHLETTEKQQQDANVRLVRLTEQMAQVKHCEKLREEVQRFEAQQKALPVFSLERLEGLRSKFDQAQQAAQVRPLLEQLSGSREHLRTTRQREGEKLRELAEITDRGRRVRVQHEELKKQVGQTGKEAQAATEAEVQARTLVTQARQQVEAFNDLAGAKMCRHCGQPLTPHHFAEEKRKRQAELVAAEAHLRQTEHEAKGARQRELEAKKNLDAASEELTETREQYKAISGTVEHLQKDLTRFQSECRRACDDLGESYRYRVGLASREPSLDDWLATTWPLPEDLTRLRTQAKQADSLRTEVREAEREQRTWDELRNRLDTARTNLQAAQTALAGDADAIRRDHTATDTQVVSLTARVKELRQQQRDVQQELDRLNVQKNEFEQKRTKFDGEQKTAETQLRLCQDEIENTRLKLPASWQMAVDRAELRDLFEYRGEMQRLEESGVEQRYKELQDVQITLETLRRNREELVAESARYPEEARCAPEEIQRRLIAARQSATSCQKAWQEAQNHKAVLENRREQRRQVQEQLLEAQRTHNRFDLLAQLLGRNHLQRHLVRQAERQIVDHANAVLDRISGGQLYLRLRGGEDGDGMAEKALDLEAFNRLTAQDPINVAFLSGSQKFRVAVSLALGLGQFASKSHRRIESVIIDEGFGCLDRQGRQVIIQELQNLRGQLRCILLVSHQEEFAEAFNDGYHFQMTDNGTKISRFQR